MAVKRSEVRMATVLCLDDFTYGLSDAVQILRENGYRVLAADDSATALELAAGTPIDAIIYAALDSWRRKLAVILTSIKWSSDSRVMPPFSMCMRSWTVKPTCCPA
jgi:response regulator RpfG family c-di-GMP phosphodiesterase